LLGAKLHARKGTQQAKETELANLRNLVPGLALGIGLLAASATVEAQESPVLDRIVQSGTLRVGMSATQPPFNVRGRGGQMLGLEVDLANLIAGAMRVELEIVDRPFGELLGALEEGAVDMVMSGMAITPRRAQTSAFVGPYMLSGKSILTKSETLAAASNTEDLNTPEIRLAALSNSTSQEFAERYTPNAQLITVSDYDEAVNMLMAGAIDALVADMPICLISLMRFPNEGLATLQEPLTIEPIGIAIPGNDPMLRNLMDNYLDAFEKTGILEQLRKKWLEDGAWIAALP
jgi:ABC-type amino acid transport substrate-binding protein